MIQIRNVPDALHRKLKARAALAGMTLSDYLLAEIRRTAERPTRHELLQRIGVTPKERMSFRLADERLVDYDGGEAVVRIDGRENTVPVVFGPDDASPLLGAVTLEIFGLSVDPVAQRLIPVDGLLKGRR